ncbi:MAG: hypothetical protein ACI9X0_002345, partial [Kiritimatiellia bacterium]
GKSDHEKTVSPGGLIRKWNVVDLNDHFEN